MTTVVVHHCLDDNFTIHFTQGRHVTLTREETERLGRQIECILQPHAPYYWNAREQEPELYNSQGEPA